MESVVGVTHAITTFPREGTKKDVLIIEFSAGVVKKHRQLDSSLLSSDDCLNPDLLDLQPRPAPHNGVRPQ